jgi:chromosome segregation ATPase
MSIPKSKFKEITQKRLKMEAESLEEEIDKFERLDYADNKLLKEYHNFEIEYSYLNAVITKIEKTIGKPVQHQKKLGNQIEKYETFNKLVVQKSVKLETLKNEVENILKESFDQNNSQILINISKMKNETFPVNLIEKEIKSLDNVEWKYLDRVVDPR